MRDARSRLLNAPACVSMVMLFIGCSSTLMAQPQWSRADSAIVRLAPSAFPNLPSAVRRDLERRGCRIPQVSFPVEKPHNVLEGAFLAPERKDWAILCSVGRISQILVYANGTGVAADSLASAEDRTFLQTGVGPNGEIGFSRLISVADAAAMRRYATGTQVLLLPNVLDHVGIGDAFIEKASTIRYFHRGKWISMLGAD